MKYVKGHLDPIHDLDFVPPYENIEADYEEGTDHMVEMHDGSRIILHKLGKDYDPTNKAQAIQAIHGSIAEGKFLTGLIYYNPQPQRIRRRAQSLRHPAFGADPG